MVFGFLRKEVKQVNEEKSDEKYSMEPRECTDLATIDPLTEHTLVTMVRLRYEEAKIRPFGGSPQHGLIYTRAGPVIVAVNPLCPVPDIYTAALRKKYHRAGACDERAARTRRCTARTRRCTAPAPV